MRGVALGMVWREGDPRVGESPRRDREGGYSDGGGRKSSRTNNLRLTLTTRRVRTRDLLTQGLSSGTLEEGDLGVH